VAQQSTVTSVTEESIIRMRMVEQKKKRSILQSKPQNVTEEETRRFYIIC
jgi:hypothetical protein